jgi:hypothetical protein
MIKALNSFVLQFSTSEKLRLLRIPSFLHKLLTLALVTWFYAYVEGVAFA